MICGSCMLLKSFSEISIHGEILLIFMAGYYYNPWRDVTNIHGEMSLLLSMARCYQYPWRDVIITIHGEMLLISMARCYYYQWRYVTNIHDEMLFLLSMAGCYYHYPWLGVIITIHGRGVYIRTIFNILSYQHNMLFEYPTYQNHLSHHPRF